MSRNRKNTHRAVELQDQDFLFGNESEDSSDVDFSENLDAWLEGLLGKQERLTIEFREHEDAELSAVLDDVLSDYHADGGYVSPNSESVDVSEPEEVLQYPRDELQSNGLTFSLDDIIAEATGYNDVSAAKETSAANRSRTTEQVEKEFLEEFSFKLDDDMMVAPEIDEAAFEAARREHRAKYAPVMEDPTVTVPALKDNDEINRIILEYQAAADIPEERAASASESVVGEPEISMSVEEEFEALKNEFYGDISDSSEDLIGLFTSVGEKTSDSVETSSYSEDLLAALLHSAEAEQEEEPEIDGRFNLGGKKAETISFGGLEADISADPDYVPPVQEDYFQAGFDEDEEVDLPERKRFGFLNGINLFGKFGTGRTAIAEVTETESIELENGPTDEPESPAASWNSMFPEETASEAIVDEVPDQEPVFETKEYTPEEIQRAYAQAFPGAQPDETAAIHAYGSGGAYTSDTDYDYGDPDGDDYEYDPTEHDYFPTFKEYVASLITAVIYRMRPGERGGSATMEDNAENLGAEVSAVNASKYYGSFARSLTLRLKISAVIMLIMAYFSVGWPLPGMLKSPAGSAWALLAMQLTVMLLALDIVTAGIMDLVRGKPGAASLGVISCILSSIDVIIMTKFGAGTPHTPLCVLSSLSMTGLLFAAMLHSKGMRKALRVPAISRRSYTVTAEMGVRPREITLLKSVRPSKNFVRRAEEAAPDEELSVKAAPYILIASLVLGLISALVKHNAAGIVWYTGAILAVSVPFTALLAFSLPFFLGSVSIFSSGAAIAGWSGLSDIGRSHNLIVTDRDIFPDGSVDFDGIRIFADESEQKVISYAGTLLAVSGSCLAAPFADLMQRNGCSMQRVENFEFMQGGGIKGMINGEVVICGNSDMLRLMNVRVPYRLVGKNTVLLAINGVLYGIFNMKYSGERAVREALVKLMKSSRHPIFAIRDFNVTPDMLREVFDIATDGYDFPPYMERYKISAATPTEDSKVAAVVCREGLGPLTHMADTGRSMYNAVKTNVLITSAGAVIGMLAMFIRILATGTVSIPGFLLMMIVFALPVFFISVFMKE